MTTQQLVASREECLAKAEEAKRKANMPGISGRERDGWFDMHERWMQRAEAAR